MSRGLLARLVVTFALAIACFCGSTLYSQRLSGQIDEAATSIAVDAMPAIVHLTETRAQLRRLDVAVGRYQAGRAGVDRDEVLAARAAVDASFEKYLALPASFPGERPLFAEMHHGLTMVDRAVDDVLANSAPTRAEVTRAVNAAAASIGTAIDLNAATTRELAFAIEQDRHRSSRVAWLLDVMSTVFTGLAAWLIVRAFAHHGRIVDERNQLLTRRAAELEQFAGRVAHDVVGPLSVTRLALESISIHDAEPTRRLVDRGMRGVDRVTVIVDGLLRFARAGARPEPGIETSVGPVVEAVVAELGPIARDAGITLFLAPIAECSVYGNAGVLSSVVENLARNAIKYMGERPVRRIDVRVDANDRVVRIAVVDTGPGIASTIIGTLFEPYVRGRGTGKPGIGLGLATVKRIVNAHGGRTGVESRLGEGSTFWCELPRADVAGAARELRTRAS